MGGDEFNGRVSFETYTFCSTDTGYGEVVRKESGRWNIIRKDN